MPFLNKWKGFWPRVETRCCLLHFLTVWNSWLRQQISKVPSLDKVLLSFCFNDEGEKAVKTKAECFKASGLFLFSSLFLSNMHYWPRVRSVWLDIWPNSFICILLDFLKVLYFIHGWLCHETSSFVRTLRDLMHWSSLRSLLRTHERSTCSKSSILFTDTKSANEKTNDANIRNLLFSHNAPNLSSKLHTQYFQFVLGRL